MNNLQLLDDRRHNGSFSGARSSRYIQATRDALLQTLVEESAYVVVLLLATVQLVG